MSDEDSKIIYISDYFKYDTESLTAYEMNKKSNIRKSIDSFKTERECARYIYDRRLKYVNREEDLRFFNIPLDAEIYDGYGDASNKYYRQEYETRRSDRDYYKRDKYGNIKKDKKGRDMMYGKFAQKGINFASNIKNSKAANTVKFIAQHIHTILIGTLVVFIILLLIFCLIYIAGVINSIGHTPFVLCTDEDIEEENKKVSIPSVDISEAASTKYSISAFIQVAKEYGWKDEAIVGTIAYILQEGGGMGTFTYESYYMANGPSEILYDKTIDNEKWLWWLNGDWIYDDKKYNSLEEAIAADDYEHIPGPGEVKAHYIYEKYYKSSHYAAIGIGLFQSTDTWIDVDFKSSNNATDLINYCNEQGKPWQDPETQLRYYFERKLNQPSAFDYGVDPTEDDLSAEEWCRRICAGIGMPGWKWNDKTKDKYYNQHTAHLEEANSYLREYTGVALVTLTNAEYNLCSRLNSVVYSGNSSIADAAVTLAATDITKITKDQDPDLEDERLKPYKTIKDAIYGDDNYYAACDRSAATVIRWSGADDTFPLRGTNEIYKYLNDGGNGKWKYVGDFGSCELQPGDVLCTKGAGHVKIYIGSAAAQKKFPGSKSDMYCGSYSSNETKAYYPRLYKDQNTDDRVYAVFRNIHPDNSSTYSSITID